MPAVRCLLFRITNVWLIKPSLGVGLVNQVHNNVNKRGAMTGRLASGEKAAGFSEVMSKQDENAGIGNALASKQSSHLQSQTTPCLRAALNSGWMESGP
jgi:hypothetical protein